MTTNERLDKLEKRIAVLEGLPGRQEKSKINNSKQFSRIIY